MGSIRKATLAIACLAMMAVALAQDEGSGSQAAWDELDPVLVIGEKTPPLWKLSKKGHVLWILGTFRPQLRGFNFNSPRLERLIAGSQQVIFPGPVYVASSGFGAMTEIVKSDRNPNGATLQSLMSADAYAKWLALKQRYSNGADVEKPGPKFSWGTTGNARWVLLTQSYRGGDVIDSMRPTFAWEGLRRAAMDRYQLASYDLESMVSAIAKKHSVPVRTLRAGREFVFIWSADPIVESLDSKKIDPVEVLGRTDYGDMGCLLANLDLLGPVMERRRIQADAWARGDFETVRDDGGVRLRDCVTELAAAVSGGRLPGSVDAQKALENYYHANRESTREVQKRWVSEIQSAVKKNMVTFSIVAIDRLVAEDGYLAALRKEGFTLEERE